jgi:hypothetical protein
MSVVVEIPLSPAPQSPSASDESQSEVLLSSRARSRNAEPSGLFPSPRQLVVWEFGRIDAAGGTTLAP